MAPDRGPQQSGYQAVKSARVEEEEEEEGEEGGVEEADAEASASPAGTSTMRQREDAQKFIAAHAQEGQNFTVRGILVGLGVGLIICFSNVYFGLQTGWVSSMSMPASLIGFAFFRTLSRHLDLPFTPVENVLVQTVAGSMGTMPLGCGFVGVMPALNYMLRAEENGPIFLSLWQLILWALGLCFFGVVFAVPLRRQVIIREKLKFPSGTATALMIGVLHGKEEEIVPSAKDGDGQAGLSQDEDREVHESNDLMPRDVDQNISDGRMGDTEASGRDGRGNWKSRVKLLVFSFSISGIYTLGTYFFPILRNLPVFGTTLANTWLWTLNPSLAYVGQGIIMGPATTTHMLLGAIVGWGILSPMAKRNGWAPGPVSDWGTGSKGWIVWVSLAIMLADAIISLGHIAFQPLWYNGRSYAQNIQRKLRRRDWKGLLDPTSSPEGYSRINGEGSTPLTATGFPSDNPSPLDDPQANDAKELPDVDAPPEHLVGTRVVWIGLILSILFCIGSIHVVFGNLVPLYATITAVLMALLLSIMGVRALGETDLNPVSGISKLAQLFFALIIPQSNKNAVLINLIAGAVSEAGALQAGDLMQDLKTGHLLGAAPNAQFWGQIIGSAVGAVASALIYRLYTRVYQVPGELFQVPTGYVWIFTARLVTGKGLPPLAFEWALAAAALFAVTTIVRIGAAGKAWHSYVPGGIAVAVGMYNVPSFTLARAIGGFLNYYWLQYRGDKETPLVVLASGLILGEGVVSIVNLLMASLRVPHL